MRSKKDYVRAIRAVREVLSDWDPYCLISGGAPADEFDDEAQRIVCEIPQMTSEKKAAHVLSRVFSRSFQPEGFSPDDCRSVGARLYRRLDRERLLGWNSSMIAAAEWRE